MEADASPQDKVVAKGAEGSPQAHLGGEAGSNGSPKKRRKVNHGR